MNILNNAHDAVEDQAERVVRLEVSETGGYAIFCVEDNGPGFTEKAREKLFEPFFTTKDVGKGTGLGLSIARNIVEAHHGELTVTSGLQATRVIMRIPKHQPAPDS